MVRSDFDQVIYVVITTEVDKKTACKLAILLLKEKLSPCVNFKNIESYFWWEGEINKSEEIQLIMKCKEKNINKVCQKISDYHSYEVPEIIYFPVSVNKEYHHWVDSF